MSDIIRTAENTPLIFTSLVIMFLMSGINKISTFNNVTENIQQKLQYNLPPQFYTFITSMVILLEIIAPIIIIYYAFTDQYKKEAYYSVIGLIIFTVLATFIYHFPDFNSYKKSIPFWANVSLIGGLLLLAKTIRKNYS